MKAPPDNAPSGADDLETGLPVFHSWRGVYLFVLGVLIVWVCLLAALTRMYS